MYFVQLILYVLAVLIAIINPIVTRLSKLFFYTQVAGDVQSSPINIDISQDLVNTTILMILNILINVFRY